ncbi:MAG: hypothetical protein RL247_868 [Actinomycetota bacterium]
MPWEGCRIVPMVVIDQADEISRVVDALRGGGIFVVEVALRTTDALEAIAIAARLGDVTVAAGTVTRAEQVRHAVDAGASFGLGPTSVSSVMEETLAARWPFIPAISTVTEANVALERGFRFQKLYPANLLGGEKFARAVGAVLPEISLLPSGGVSETNAATYLAEPNIFAVTGSWIAPRELIAAGDFEEITRRAARASEIAKAYG